MASAAIPAMAGKVKPKSALRRIGAAALMCLVAAAAATAADADAGLEAYERGDFEVAYQEWRQLADRGEARAQYNLGLLYHRGQGVAPDLSQAAQWYALAAAQGVTRAQVELAALIANGSGVDTDLALAHALLAAAERAGDDQASRHRQSIENLMTAEESARAEDLNALAERGGVAALLDRRSPMRGAADSVDGGVVVEVQRSLSDLGYDPGAIDGVPGPATAAAVRAFQTDSGLPVDGAITPGLMDQLAVLAPAPPLDAAPDQAGSGEPEPDSDSGGPASMKLPPASVTRNAVCPHVPEQPYKFEVAMDVPPPSLSRKMTRNDLTVMSQTQSATTLGLTRYDLQLSWNVSYGVSEIQDRYCVWVNGVQVKLRQDLLDVYVAAEYPPDSCAYRAILAHEQRHVTVAKNIVERYRGRLKQAMTSLTIPKSTSPIVVTSTAAAEQKIEALFKQLIGPVYGEMSAQMEKAQALVDAPIEYERVWNQCRDW